jgi:hypothetical protein
MKTDLMQEDILDAVRKNLPAQMVGVLQDELKELDRLRVVDQQLADLQSQLSLGITKRRELELELSAWKTRADSLEKREADVLQAELRQENVILKIKLEEAEKRAIIGQDIVKDVFKNRSVVESMTLSYPNGGMPTWGPNGGSPATPSPTFISKNIAEV